MGRDMLLKCGFLVVLVAGAAAGGLYLSGGWPGGEPHPQPPGQPAPAADDPPRSHHFALSALDAKDTIEAPTLAIGPGGSVFLAWASKTGEAERTVLFTRSTDGGRTFENPKAVSKGGIYKTAGKGKGGGYERRATPHLAVTPAGLHLSWGEALPDRSAMRMLLASSADAGVTFDTPRPVHTGTRANPTFTAMGAGPGGALACAWLDDRAGAQQPFAAIRPAGAATFEPERLVAAGQDGQGVCPCCPTAACFAPDGTLLVGFRNIQDGYRDIAIGRLRPGQSAFEGPFPVIGNTWKFDGCPHDGPSLTVTGDTLHVAWMDARGGPQRCYYARAKLPELKFEVRELHPNTPGTQGNPKLLADTAGALHAVWEASLGTEPAAENPTGHQHGPPKVGAAGGRAVMYAVMPAGQTEFGGVRAVAPKPGAFQTRPVLAAGDGTIFVAWNELDTAGKAVVVTRLAGPAEGARP